MTVKISVVMPTYESEKTVLRSLNSYIKQDYENKNLIIIDGGSSDKTLDIVSDLNIQSVTVVSEKDDGIYDALNKGIALADGDIVGLLHSNDFYANDAVLSKIGLAFECSGLDAVYADVEMFVEENPDKVERHYDSSIFKPNLLKMGIMPAHPTLYLKRSVFKKFGLYDPTYKIAGDFEFVARIFKDELIECQYFDEVWFKMALGGASTGGFKSKFKLNQETIKACHSLGIEANWWTIFQKYILKFRSLQKTLPLQGIVKGTWPIR